MRATTTSTHEVTNQSVPFEDLDYFEADLPLRELPHPQPELAAAAIVGALAEALLGPLARRETDAAALVAGLQSFVLSAVENHAHAHV